MTTPQSKVVIVGAGVFGLSTALHLAQNGYKDLTVFDCQPYDKNGYNPDNGCDAASADVNKIYRCSYGAETEYQNLAYSGRPEWLRWNAELANTPASALPPGLTPDTTLFEPCGYLRISAGPLSPYDRVTLKELEKAGLGDWQYVLGEDERRLDVLDELEPAWKRRVRGFRPFCAKGNAACIDTSAGFTYADKACAWARFLCERAGVKFVLGAEGRFSSLVIEDGKARGIITEDGKRHPADVVVVACGGWTPSLVPEVSQLLETTAGSVITYQIPRGRKDLWDEFAPENMPVWSYALTGHESVEFGGVYGFPRTPEGKVKIGYRGRKWTNFQTNPQTGERISMPRTKYTAERATSLPKEAIRNAHGVVNQLFPDLAALGIAGTRMCWYTDSIDNSVSSVPVLS